MSKRDSGTWLIAFIAGHVLAFGLNWAWGVSFNQPWFAYLVLTVVGVSLSFLVGRKCYGTHNPTCEKVTTPQNPSHPVDTSQSSELETKIGNEASELKASELADLEKVKATPSLDSLLGLSPIQFEHIVAEMFRAEGFTATVTSQSNDYGRDIILRKNAKTTFVECKRYGQEKFIGRPALQKFHGAIVSLKAANGIFVTTSDFAETAHQYAIENGIEPLNGKQLVRRMLRAFPPSLSTTL